MHNKLEIAGITILSSRQNNDVNFSSFKILKGEEASALSGLIAALAYLDSVSLADHSRGDFESLATYKRTESGYRVMVGGHGWSGDWIELNSAEITQHMQQRVQYNYGNHPSETGRLQQTKRQIE